jgi:hypothetical protein
MIFFNRFIGIIGLYHLVNGFRGIQYQIYKHPIMKNTIGVVRSSSNDKLNEEIQIDFELIEPSARSLDPPEYEGNKRNKILAVLSSAVGIALFTFSQSQSAVSGVALLKAMERDSPAIEVSFVIGYLIKTYFIICFRKLSVTVDPLSLISMHRGVKAAEKWRLRCVTLKKSMNQI